MTERNSSTGEVDRQERLQRVKAVLMTYCDPKLKYDGMSAHELAEKVLAVIDPVEAAFTEADARKEFW